MAQRRSGKYEDNVFINCPFDDQYKPLLNAIIFAIHDSGFVARCALEAMGSEKTRLAKILEIIADCQYGIHDISRIEISDKNLPRFNMPFECGLYWGCKEYGGNKQQKKRILVLDSEPHRYQQTLSDISGQDIKAHKNDPRIAIDKIRSWLKSTSGRTDIPGGKVIWDHFILFQQELPTMLQNANITPEELNTPEYYPDYIAFIVVWLIEREKLAAKRK